MTSNETYVVAGYVAGYHWKPPAQYWTKHLPPAVVSVSDCLTDFLPKNQDPLTAPWHTTVQEAVKASQQTSAGTQTAHVLAMSVPAPAVGELATMIEEWIGDYHHPIQANLAHSTPTPLGTIQGFEVLGFETGRFHSWLCYVSHIEVFDKLDIRANDRGLLATLLEAQQVTRMINNHRGTRGGTSEDITWFPALITEYDTEQPVQPN